MRTRDGTIELLHDNESLPYRVFDAKLNRPIPADDKSLNTRVDQALQRRATVPWKPPAQHPWR